ncbi:putative oxidoreductase [Zancudomyces culisetae]|uniref:Putative oxidoreductase n=1 Tax=Zancudomyces culisetae TaxID=1213189 RepID=A0A1R1PVP9_ZANCU|nr:putative oxidoreductase [Zancudomyces culisetae]|eukprot:OMH84972.1 putative oxidoreductase [Zancudomyces culisetae]
MFERIRNKTVVITGASSGFGKSMAQMFARYGAHVVIFARRLDRLEEIKAEILETHPTAKVHAAKMDVSEKNSVVSAFANLPEWASKPDVLINNAGIGIGFDTVEEVSEDVIEKTLKTNVSGVVFCTQQVLPGMKERNEGMIINIGSILGQISIPNISIYCASKHALRAITDSLRIETNSTKIRVAEIDPGMAKTEFNLVRVGYDEEKAQEIYNGLDAMSPEDVAELALFVASRHPRCVISHSTLLPQAEANPFVIRRETE